MNHDSPAATIPVPSWMVRLGILLIGSLSTGASITVGGLVWRGFDLESRVSHLESKEADVVSAFSTFSGKIDKQTDAIQQLQRDVDVLKSRDHKP